MAPSLIVGQIITGLQVVSATAPTSELLSKSVAGQAGDQDAHSAQIPSDGRYTVYYSASQNILPNVPQNSAYFYLYDRQDQTTTIIDSGVSTNGGNITSYKMSANARYLVFRLTDGWLYRYDRDIQQADVIGSGVDDVRSVADDGSALVSLTNNLGTKIFSVVKLNEILSGYLNNGQETLSAGLSANGQRVSYVKSLTVGSNHFYELHVLDVVSGQEILLQQVPHVSPYSNSPTPAANIFGMSDTGRYIGLTLNKASVKNAAYPSACELHYDFIGCQRAYRYDTLTNTFELADVLSSGADPAMAGGLRNFFTTGMSMSANGDKISFAADFSGVFHGDQNQVVYVHDFTAGDTEVLGGSQYTTNESVVALNQDGSQAAYTGWAGGYDHQQVFSYDLTQAFTDQRDRTLPVVQSVNWLGNNPKTATTVENLGVWVYMAATDDSKIIQVECTVDNLESSRVIHAAYSALWVGPNYMSACFVSDSWGVGAHSLQLRVEDGAGNWGGWQEEPFTVTPDAPQDSVPPTLGTFAWSLNPKTITQTTTLTIPVNDDSSGVAAGEYFIGDIDPGQGNGATMNWDGTSLTSTFGTDFPTGVYKISVRAVDNAGNWNDPVSDYLVVYNPDGPRMTGKKSIVPSVSSGDILPGLIATNQTDKATFGFSIKYNNQGIISTNSDLQFKYSTGTHCNNPGKAQNCHSLELNATSIAWLTMQSTNNSTGIFQGTGTLVLDGVTSTVIFRITGVDGERLSPTASDQFQIKVYNQSDNPNIAIPLYQVNSANITRGNIKIT
jgi:hypothetical protein